MYHNFLSKYFSHITEKCRRGTLLCFRKFRVSKKLIDKRRWVFITIFCQSLCLTVPENFVGQLFCVSEKTGYRRNLRRKRGIHYYLMIFFCSTVPKIFGAETLRCFRKILVSQIFIIREEGVVSRYLSKSLSHTTGKFRRGTLLCFRKFLVSKNVMDKKRGDGITIFCQSLCLTVPKSFVGEPHFFSKIVGYREFLWIREEGAVSQFFVIVFDSQYRKMS